MAVGLRAGLKVGLCASSRVGVGVDQIGGGGVTQTTLTAVLSDSIDPVLSAMAFSYSLVVANVGAVDATTVSAAVTLDSAVTFVSASGTGWTCNASGQVVTCTRASMSAGAAPTITINVTSGSATATLSTTASISASNVVVAAIDSESTSCLLVAKDATDGRRYPASATEWGNVLTYIGATAGNPSLLWGMQDASGNPADSIGAFTGTAGGSLTYQQSVSGLSRKGITFAAGSATVRNTSASLPDVGTSSMLTFAVLAASNANGPRTYIQMGTVFGADVNVEASSGTTFKIVAHGGANAAAGTPVFADGTLRPLVLKIDRTGAVVTAYTDQEKLSPAIGGSGKNVMLGGDNVQTYTSPPMTVVYFTAFFNAAAERADAVVKLILQTLGWTVAW